MKRFFAVLLVCAMFLPILASCGSLQAGELDVESYPQTGDKTQNVADLKEVTGYEGRTELDTSGGEYHGDGENGVIEGKDTTDAELDQTENVNGTYDTFYTRKAKWTLTLAEWFAECDTSTFVISKDLGKVATDDYYPEYKGKKIYEIYTAEQFASFMRLLNYTVALATNESGEITEAVHEDVAAAGYDAVTKKPWIDFSDKVIVLKRDFDFSKVEVDLGYIWSDGTSYFNGILDGEGHVVNGKNMTSNGAGKTASLFGVLVDATIKDVAFTNCTFTDTKNLGSSGLALWCAGDVNLDNVYLSATFNGGQGNLGGLIGVVRNGKVDNNTTPKKVGTKLSITNTTVDVDINNVPGNTYGGMLGWVPAANSVTISNCKVDCNMTVSAKISVSTSTMLTEEDGSTGKTDADGNEMYQVKTIAAENVNFGGMIASYDASVSGQKLTIQDCEVTGSITAAGDRVGGVIGVAAGSYSYPELSNVTSRVALSLGDSITIPSAGTGKAYYNAKGEKYSAADVLAANIFINMGGFIGYKSSGSGLKMTDCFNYGSVSGARYVGGLIGQKGNSSNYEFSLTRCENHGDIVATGEAAGGLIGQLNQTMNANKTPATVFTDCKNTGDVTGVTRVGGMFGICASDRTWTMTGCENTGNITATGNEVGGLIGITGNNTGDAAKLIDNCKNNADVKGAQYVGGLVGTHNGAGLTIQNSENRGTVSAESNLGGIFGSAVETTIEKLTITGTHNYAAVTGTSGYAGGLVGQYSGVALNISESSNNGAVNGNGSTVGGILGISKDGSTVITITNVTNNGDVTNGDAYTSGIVGQSNSNSSSLTITGTTNNGTVSGSGNYVSGVLGFGKGNVSIDGCVNTGDLVFGGDRVAGIVADFSGTGKTLTIKNSRNEGDLKPTVYQKTAGRFAGGVVGYVHGSASSAIASVTVENCVNTGDVIGNRASGGLIAYIQHTKNVTIKNNTVSANMEFLIYEASNQFGGGIIGLLCECETIEVSGCVVTGALLLADKVNSTAYAGGLIGNIRNTQDVAATDTTEAKNNTNFTSTTVTISDCIVSVDFAKSGYTASDTGDKVEVFYANNNNENLITITCENLQYVAIDSDATNEKVPDVTATAKRTTKLVGQQHKVNDDGTYSMRYVFKVADLSDLDKAIGFDVSIEYKDGTNRYVTVYCPTIYTSVISGDETFTAEEGEYLFTLAINNIPADQITTASNGMIYITDAIINIDSFTAYNEDAKLSGASVRHGSSDAYGNQHTMGDSNFNAGGEIFSVLEQDDVITVPFSQIDERSGGLGTGNKDLFAWIDSGTASGHGIDKIVGSDTGSVFHWYFQGVSYFDDFEGSLYDAFMRLEVEIPEDGDYELYFHLRLKQQKDTRYVVFAIDDAPVSEQHYLTYTVTAAGATAAGDGAYNATSNPDGSNGTYVRTGITLNLTKGAHTITFKMPVDDAGTGISSASMHFRVLYLVPAN